MSERKATRASNTKSTTKKATAPKPKKRNDDEFVDGDEDYESGYDSEEVERRPPPRKSSKVQAPVSRQRREEYDDSEEDDFDSGYSEEELVTKPKAKPANTRAVNKRKGGEAETGGKKKAKNTENSDDDYEP